MISGITIREYDEFRISHNLDLLVPNLTRSRRDLKKRLLKLTNKKEELSDFGIFCMEKKRNCPTLTLREKYSV